MDPDRFAPERPGSHEWRSFSRCQEQLKAIGLFIPAGFMHESAVRNVLRHAVPGFPARAFLHSRKCNADFDSSLQLMADPLARINVMKCAEGLVLPGIPTGWHVFRTGSGHEFRRKIMRQAKNHCRDDISDHVCDRKPDPVSPGRDVQPAPARDGSDERI